MIWFDDVTALKIKKRSNHRPHYDVEKKKLALVHNRVVSSEVRVENESDHPGHVLFGQAGLSCFINIWVWPGFYNGSHT